MLSEQSDYRDHHGVHGYHCRNQRQSVNAQSLVQFGAEVRQFRVNLVKLRVNPRKADRNLVELRVNSGEASVVLAEGVGKFGGNAKTVCFIKCRCVLFSRWVQVPTMWARPSRKRRGARMEGQAISGLDLDRCITLATHGVGSRQTVPHIGEKVISC